MIKVGLIGPKRSSAGYGIGQFLAREILNSGKAELQAILGTTDESVKQAVAELNSRNDINKKFAGQSYPEKKSQDFFNSDLDLIIIGSPPKTHANYINKSLIVDKHVFSEKPLLENESIDIAQELIELADKKNLFLVTNCQRAQAVNDLNINLSWTLKPKKVEIDITIGTKDNKVETVPDLFDMMISHPLSFLVKYGITDFNAVKINDFAQNSNEDVSELMINGSANSRQFIIKSKQTKSANFAGIILKIDDNQPVEITTVQQNNKLMTQYITANQEFYTDDHLKTSVIKMIEAVYYNNDKHLPLISNQESLLIYAGQMKIRDLIF